MSPLLSPLAAALFGAALAASPAFATPSPPTTTEPATRAAPAAAPATPVVEPARPATAAPWRDALREAATRPAGHSGFRLLSMPANALASRLALADAATTSIDLQTYIYEDDATGRLLAAHLLKAADRGVAVRLLVDAYTKPDPQLLDSLDAHPRIEVRLFNPFDSRDPGALATVADMLSEFRRLNRRMHNKSFIVDDEIMIVGGRNIGDEYFDASDGNNFRDLDLLAIGSVVGDAAAAFDVYWADASTAAVSAIAGGGGDEEDLEEVREDVAETVADLADTDLVEAFGEDLPHGPSATRAGRWAWGPAELVADHPDKVETAADAPDLRIGPRLREVLDAARAEVLMITPYFVPGDADIAHLVGLAGRGVDVAVLTNSLESTDHASVHGGYAERRRPLLEGGVRLFEFRSRPERPPTAAVEALDANVALHAKAFVVDRRVLFVGSLNMDQRSQLLNTEMGLIVDNAELAGAVARYFERNTRPTTAYAVRIDPDGGDLHWHTVQDGEPVDHSREPDAGPGRRAATLLPRLLPIDSLL